MANLSVDQWIALVKGKSIDFDGAAGVQCVDLVKHYLKYCFNIRAGSWGDAKYYYLSFNNTAWGGYNSMHKYFERIPNTPSFVPQKGDICVWSGQYGHVSIADGVGTTSYFYSYDQNWGGKPCKRVKHKYTDFLGVLRPTWKCVTVDLNIRSTPVIEKNNIVGVYDSGTLVKPIKTLGNFTETEPGKWVVSKYLG